MSRSTFKGEVFFNDVLPLLLDAPSTQMDEDMRRRVHDFISQPTFPGDAAVYDFMDSLAEAAFHGKASSFVMTLCDVRTYYVPPPSSKFEGIDD